MIWPLTPARMAAMPKSRKVSRIFGVTSAAAFAYKAPLA